MGGIDKGIDFFRETLEPKKVVYGIVLFAIFIVALWVRYIPVENMDYIQALDPYMITRMSASIAESGSLPTVDVLRYFPYFNPVYMINEGTVVIPALMFQVARQFGIDFLTWAQFYPALMGALAVIPLYFIGKKMFDKKAGLFAAFFLATSVAVMHRSSAGWFGKEPPAMFLMITSIYFFFKSWDENKWWPGIVSGVLMGISGTAWGGTRFLYMLYPFTVIGFVAVLPILASIFVAVFDGKMKKLEVDRVFKAFAPVALLGTPITIMLDGSANTLSFPNAYTYFHLAVLGFLAARYFIEKFELVSKDNVPYISHSLVLIGGLALLLSPVYSQTVADTTSSVISRALQDSTGVIGGTVAENTPATIDEVVVQLGASMSGEFFADYLSGWTFGLIGIGIISVFFICAFFKYYFEVDKIGKNVVVGGVSIAVSLTSLIIYYGLDGEGVSGFLPAIVLTTITTSSVFVYNSFTDKEMEQWKTVILMFWLAIFIISVFLGQILLVAILGALQGIFLAFQRGEKITVEFEWSYLIIFVWIASTIYGATRRSRLFILTGAPVALVAGLGVSKSIDYVRSCNFWDTFRDNINLVLMGLFLTAFCVSMITVNLSAVNARADRLGGSPEQPWYEAFEYMREETPEGSVMLSWWDYGYWTQSIGERPTIADGGNHFHYRNENITERVNYPIADFLSSSEPENHTDWLEMYGADYIFLDRTMIGKYSAVSQIAHRSNEEFYRMQELNCVFDENTGSCKISQLEDNTVIHYDMGGEMELLLPLDFMEEEIQFTSTPVIRYPGETRKVANICSEQGLINFEEGGSTGGIEEAFGETFQEEKPFGGCVSVHPFYGPSTLVMVPPAIMDSTFVRLYLMDGQDIDFVEKVFDNGYVKMWEIER